MTIFSENLKYLREKYDDTQSELAEFLGKKSLSSVSDWERGKSTPNAKTLSIIANRYNVTIDDLMEVDLANKHYDEPKTAVHMLDDLCGDKK